MSDESLGSFDVAIVGYGPTGLSLAYWLGRAGIKTVVIERWPELYTLPRAGHVDAEVMRLFQRMGVAETIAADSSLTRHTVLRDADGQQMAVVPAEESDQGWWSHYSLYQPMLERLLDAKVRGTGHVTVMQGWRVEGIEHLPTGEVRLRIAAGESRDGHWRPIGAQGVIRAQWLVGADGANSIVREDLQTSDRDLGYRSRALVIFADRLDPAVGADMPDSEVGMLLPRPYCAWRESGKRYARWEFVVQDDESAEQMNRPEAAWELIGQWGFTPDNARLIRHNVFEFQTVIADAWRRGNVILAGDAAHRMPPFQGQGMCSGQRDAAALAWRLDLVIRGVADPAILDSYTEERKPQVENLILNAAERGQLFWSIDPDVMHRRDEQMRARLVSDNLTNGYGGVPPLAAGILMHGPDGPRPPAGQLSAQFPVRHSGRELLLDDYVGPRWMLLSQGRSLTGELSDADRDLLAILGVVEVVLGENEQDGRFVDVSGGYGRWLEQLGCNTVLVRPDCYVFGVASDARELHAVLASLSDQLRLIVKAA